MAASSGLTEALAQKAAPEDFLSASPEVIVAEPGGAITLYVNKIGRYKVGYGLSPDKATIPGPTIIINEGDSVTVEVVNKTNKTVSFHAHGVDYAIDADGTTITRSAIKPGKSRSHLISTHLPGVRGDGSFDPGSAGYWHYHDHAMGSHHGTGGIAAGLFGGLIVRRAGDLVPDVDPIVLVMNDMTFNLKSAPTTPLPQANLGQRVEFVVIGHGELFHTFHLHGHRWADTRTGMLASADDSSRVIDNRTIGPADSFGFQVLAGEHVGEGAWMYHCHVQSHSDFGMSGLFIVRGADGVISASTQDQIDRWTRSEGGGSHH